MDSNKITNNANREVPLNEVRVSYMILSPLSWQNFPTPKKKQKTSYLSNLFDLCPASADTGTRGHPFNIFF